MRRYLVTGVVEAGRSRLELHTAVINAMAQVARFGPGAEIAGDQAAWREARAEVESVMERYHRGVRPDVRERGAGLVRQAVARHPHPEPPMTSRVRRLAALALVVVALAACGGAAATPAPAATVGTGAAAAGAPAALPAEVDVAKAKELQAAGAFILDVREPSEWAEGHIDGATLIPLGELATASPKSPGTGRSSWSAVPATAPRLGVTSSLGRTCPASRAWPAA